MTREAILRRRVKWLTWFFIIGLVISGVTAIPLLAEVNWLVTLTRAGEFDAANTPIWAMWLLNIQTALQNTNTNHPELFYGTDWLGFGHIVIAIAFVGALRDPIRNRWLFDFGLIACVLVIPFAIIFGAVRGIPFWWRLIDCSFGVFGAIPILLCRKWVSELDTKR